jgi:hypothetical protein
MFLFNRRIVIGAFVLLSLLIGLGYYFTAKRIYSSKLTAESMHLSDGRILDLVGDLKRLLKDEDVKSLAIVLHLSDSAAKSIEGLETFSKIDIDENSGGADVEFKEGKGSQFSIIAKTSDYRFLPEIQAGLVRYLSENPYAKMRAEQEKEYLKNNIAEITKEIQKADSVNESILSGTISRSSTLVTTYGQNAQALSELYERRNRYIQELNFTMPIRVIQPFTIFTKPISPKLTLSILLSLPIGLVLGLIAVFVYDILRFVKQLATN